MSTDVIQYDSWPNQTLLADLFPIGSDTASFTGLAFSERSLNLGTYRVNVVNPTAGEYVCNVKDAGGNILDKFHVVLTNTGAVHYPLDAADVKAVDASLEAGANLSKSSRAVQGGTVDSTAFTPTTTEFESSNQAPPTTSSPLGRALYLRHAAGQYEAARITAYSVVSGRGHFTVQTLASAPTNGAEFVIV
jgi:hypothetical protein